MSSLWIDDGMAQMRWVARKIMVPFFLRKALEEKEIEEGIIRANTLDWIIVRPDDPDDGLWTGVYRCMIEPHAKVGQSRTTRADVADFILQNLMDERFVHRAVALTF